MRFRIKLRASQPATVIPINYPYALSAVIFKILHQADEEYAAFLHDKGYVRPGSLKVFKLFSFSEIRTAFRIEGDRFRFLSDEGVFTISFHLPQAAESFIRGLFLNETIEIGDRRSKGVFTVTEVQSVMTPLEDIPDGEVREVMLQPFSPLVCGTKNDRGYYDFLSPQHPDFVKQLVHNWREKFITMYGEDQADTVFDPVTVEVVMMERPPKSRLVTIKADTPQETKIRGYTNFRLKVKGAGRALKLLADAGAGVYNSSGMGSLHIL
ncbi:CRISPR-associated endoribonuclease Cas6 [Chitinophaga qingshengii]|uniref:CRISPR-associated endoribonuclease Cas6 n=1 Tax=Chitinophaga qingshengii TaxID=1569794 RepID=A0ABR7TNX4_9BACT|nr:CRISPR-associated endoribonuclease Cas6 [Chitinophaga qingshengii]MBC9932181.1 CRISPR-associated endoribonuclease Cas6 [Chitinophaga qingshengii]